MAGAITDRKAIRGRGQRGGRKRQRGEQGQEKGQGQEALEQFQQVANAGDLDREQRAFVLESIQRIKQRTGL